MVDLKDKVAIVTGGGTGIGLAITQTLISLGMKVVITSRDEANLCKQAQQLNQNDESVYALPCNVRNKSEVESVVAATLAKFGTLDVLINNAGLGVQDKVIDCSEEDWDMVLETCTKGTFLMTQAVLPTLQKKRDGFIINIASQAAKNGYDRTAPYCAAKFGVLGFGLALQEEVREFGIKVHSLCPGLVQVPQVATQAEMTPGWLQPEDLAQTVAFLLQQPKRVYFDNIGLWGMA